MKVQAPARRAMSHSGFSLVELLVVMLIIVLVVAIVVPALGGVRTAAREADTKNLITNISQACSQFVLSERRVPGYFSPREMGDAQNGTINYGISVMQNAMLDLAGGIVTGTPAGSFDVGPTATSQVRVDPNLIGTTQGSSKAYFTPAAKFFKKHDGSGNGGGDRFSNARIKDLPEVTDSFGSPVLMWTPDPMAIQPVAAAADFALEAPGTAPSRYYWNSNSAFLNSGTFVGLKRIDQGANSLIGKAHANHVTNMIALLGNPAFANDQNLALSQILPTAPRGQFTIHSAGKDGTYLGVSEKGGKLAEGNGGVLWYGLNFYSGDGAPLIDSSDKPSSRDVVAEQFNDVIVSGS
jgi:prepilin-type N-terminal cleavage/methylation domain-containing protein